MPDAETDAPSVDRQKPVKVSPMLRTFLPAIAGLGMSTALLAAPVAIAQTPSQTGRGSGTDWLRAPTSGIAQPGANQQTEKPDQPPETLPNGASAINEVYGDWTVDCRITDGRRLCVLTQLQGNSQTNQRVFAIELRAPSNGKTEGAILMPFGLKLENGAILRLDDKDLGQGLRFSTCVPAGCLLPVSFPTVAIDAMKAGKTLTTAALNLSSSEPVTFDISLNGFAAALARIGQLAA